MAFWAAVVSGMISASFLFVFVLRPFLIVGFAMGWKGGY